MSQYTKIYEYVIDRGYHSITNFCREFGISPTVFSDLKTGKTKSLSTKNIMAVAEALNVSIDELVDENEQGDKEIINFTYQDFVSLCEAKNISTAKAAKLSNISNTTILRWRNGENEPTYLSKRKLVHTLNNLSTNRSVPERKNQSLSPVPIYGSIHAGSPTIAQQEIIGYSLTDKPNPDEYFILTVNGDSMEPTISDGMKVLVKIQNTAEDGEIVACIVDGEEATLKRIKFYGQDTIYLLPENNKYEPIHLKQSDFENGQAFILGVVKQCIKDF